MCERQVPGIAGVEHLGYAFVCVEGGEGAYMGPQLLHDHGKIYFLEAFIVRCF